MNPAGSLGPFRNFRSDQYGGMTILGIMMTFLVLAVGGIAADYANAIRTRTYLQVAADAAAHAALIEREFGTVAEARAKGLQIANATIQPGWFGDAIRAEDINFGHWDRDTLTFAVDNTSRDAVIIDTARIAERSNSVSTYFLRLVGFGEWNVRRQTVFETYNPRCLVEGYVSDTHVEIGQHSLFENPFCIHSNNTIAIQSFNVFEPGVWVHAPDLASVSASSSNTGLSEALRPKEAVNLRIVERISDIADGVVDPSSVYFPEYITDTGVVDFAVGTTINSANWQEGRIHRAVCSNPKGKLLISSTTLRSGVLVTNCMVQFESAVLEDVIIVSESTEAKAFSGSSSIQLGRSDNCGPGGGAQLVTLGGVDFAAKLQLHSGQMIAAGDIKFVSHADGHWGGSVIAGGVIDSGNHVTQRSCDGVGSEGNFTAAYFRLAY